MQKQLVIRRKDGRLEIHGIFRGRRKYLPDLGEVAVIQRMKDRMLIHGRVIGKNIVDHTFSVVTIKPVAPAEEKV